MTDTDDIGSLAAFIGAMLLAFAVALAVIVLWEVV